jgi:alkanesulfonate monooxygenase SsuD/methylene tetrahydromethanopterin reductase-like flavin-dependent oxidoreductase (luciferase family)
MRPGIGLIPHAIGDSRAVSARIAAFGRRAEALGFAGVWVTDSMARARPTLDPLSMLALLCGVTNTIELGTCVVQVPLRHPVEHAHRAQSLHVLSGGRFRFGIGSGSTLADFEALQQDFDARFRTLPAYMAVMRRVWAGEAVYGPPLPLWPGTEGGPPVLLGAWRSQRWIDYAVTECQGWISSGIYSSLADLETGIGMYRAAGGTRAVLANVFVDLRPEPTLSPLISNAKVSLICSPAEARERLGRLAALGFDDVLLVPPFDAPHQLEAIRALL